MVNQGISSDQLFGYEDADTSEARHERMAKLSALHGARVSSALIRLSISVTSRNGFKRLFVNIYIENPSTEHSVCRVV